jgi:hypothetical protein
MQVMAQAFPTLKQYDNSGSPTRVAREDWSLAAWMVKNKPAWQAWVKSRQKSLEMWISKPRDRADMIAGWGHDLYDAKGVPVQWSANMAEPSKSDPGGTKFWGAWVYYVRSYNIGRIQEAARLYRLTGNTILRDWAIAQLDFYAANYSSWPLQKTWPGQSSMFWQSLDEAAAMPILIDAVRLLEPDLGQAHLSSLYTHLFSPMVKNLLVFNKTNNMGTWVASAIAEVAIEFGEPALLDTSLNGKFGLFTLLKTGVTTDYLWNEGTFGYNNYVVLAMAPLFILADLKGQNELLQFAKLAAENMLLSPLQFRFNDGYLPFMGDVTGGRLLATNSGIYQALVRTIPTTIGLHQEAQTWDSLIDPQTIYTQQPSLPIVTTALFDPDRIAVLKNSYWQAFVHYGQLVSYHAEYEVPGYEIYWQPATGKSIPVAANQGTVDYGSPYHNQYFIRGVAHNVALVDGEGQDTLPLTLQVDNFDKDIPTITVSHKNYKKGAAVSRTISLQGSAFDESTSISLVDTSSNRRLGVVLNTECQLNLSGSNLNPFQTTSVPQGIGFSYWSGVTMTSAPTQWNGILVCSGQSFTLQVTSNLPHKIYLATAPAIPLPNTREAIYLEILGRSAKFEMKISPM